MTRIHRLLIPTIISFASLAFADEPACKLTQIKVPDGYTVELAAASPLVKHPLMACFDEVGRLYVAANAGRNLRREDLEKELPNYVQRLEDTNGDGVFDKSVVFADKMTFPQGCLWYRGSLYVASSGAIWKLTDTDDDGQADERSKLVGDFGYNGNAADIHGPFLGREGRIWWCEGRHGHEFRDEAGNVTSRGKAARIFNCLPDGSDVQTWCTGGMDNPVEIVFTPEGDVLGTVNLMYARPRGDCLVHWQWGGVYPREDFVDSLGGEFYRTGELLSEVHNFGHVALSGLCRYESKAFGDDAEGDLFITQFNTGKIVRTKLKRAGATYEVASNADFLVADCEDFHPTDVLEDADGSLLVIDTGGWFRIGCPESQVAKPEVHGAIYRVRKRDAAPVGDPRGLDIAWDQLNIGHLLELMTDDRIAVRQRAVDVVAQLPNQSINIAMIDEFHAASPPIRARQASIWALSQNQSDNGRFWFPEIDSPGESVSLKRTLVAAYALKASPPKLPPMLVSARATQEDVWWRIADTIGLTSDDPALQAVAARLVVEQEPRRAIGTLAQAFKTSREDLTSDRELDPSVKHAIVFALIQIGDRDALIATARNASPPLSKLAGVALEQLRRDLTSVAADDAFALPPPEVGVRLTEEQRANLSETERSLPEGNFHRGRKLYVYSKRTDCRKCHRIDGEGGLVGPDLSNVGSRRSRRDLLESILFPSASFVRGFESYALITEQGKSHSGVILGETAETITVGIDADANESNAVKLHRNEIEEIKATNVSIMPANVYEQLSEQELADLLAYLLSLKGEKESEQ